MPFKPTDSKFLSPSDYLRLFQVLFSASHVLNWALLWSTQDKEVDAFVSQMRWRLIISTRYLWATLFSDKWGASNMRAKFHFHQSRSFSSFIFSPCYFPAKKKRIYWQRYSSLRTSCKRYVWERRIFDFLMYDKRIYKLHYWKTNLLWSRMSFLCNIRMWCISLEKVKVNITPAWIIENEFRQAILSNVS